MSRTSSVLVALSIVLFFALYGCVLSPKEVKYVYITEQGMPELSVIEPANNSVIHTNVSTVHGTAAINSTNTITDIKVKVNNGSYTTASGTSNWTASAAFTNGQNTISIIAVSDLNKTNTATVAFEYDTSAASTNSDSYTPGSGWSLCWSDEFNGTALDETVWTKEVRGDGCGNSELEYYTDRLNNVWVNGGTLVIKAIYESYSSRNYTSGRLNSKDKYYKMYGKIAARIKLPYGTSLWPAFWMMGQTNLGWPNNGEIDIMEYRGDMISRSSGALHGPNYSGGSCYSSTYTAPSNLTNDFHIYEMIWDTAGITLYVDGTQFFSKTKASVTGAGNTWVYDRPMYFLINLAVGGTSTPYTGNQSPNNSVFPVYMFVDWVRIYTN